MGTICYELLVGKPLFEAKTMDELLSKVKKGNIKIPSHLSKEVINFLSNMLTYDSKYRASAKDLLNHPFIRKNNINPEDIAGVGLCGHGKGLYLWGKDGHPVRRGIISSDNRAWKYAKDWKEDGDTVSFLYSGDINRLTRILADTDLKDLTIAEPDLEEIILHYYEKGGEQA